MKLTSLAIKNNRLSIGILLAVLFMGIATFNDMPRDDFPPFTLRRATVITFFPGATPERMEMLVSDKIEKTLQEIPEVDFISSESRTGISIVAVAIKESETEMRPIFDEIRRKIGDMKSSLPEGIIGPTVNDDLLEVFGVLVGLTGEGYSSAELLDVAEEVRDVLIKIPDAAKVEIAGAQEERIFIEYDNARLAEVGLTTRMLQQILTSQNIIFPGGEVTVGTERVMLEPTGNFLSIDDLQKTIVKSTSENKLIRLEDIATIRRGYSDPKTNIVKINGVPGIVVGVSVKEGGNIIRLGKEVNNKIDQLREIYPIGIEFERVASQDEQVNESVNDCIVNVLQSIAIVLIVMLLFLGFRTGIVVASLIPMAIVVTLFVMYRINVGLNQVSLASLIIALGMLVDNAIVMSESIMVKLETGEKPYRAAIDSAKELYLPLFIASLTTSAAFLAFFLANSIMGEIMGQIFMVVTTALLVSWLLSITIIPMFCMYFIKVKKGNGKGGFGKLIEVYSSLLKIVLKHSFLFTGMIVIVFFLGMYGFSFVPFLYVPDSERGIVQVNVELPLGTRIERTEAVVNELEQFIHDSLKADDSRTEGVVSWSSYIGQGAPKYDLGYIPPESSPNAAHILINTTGDRANQLVIDKLDALCFENFPEVTAMVNRLGSGGAGVYPIAIRLTGKNTDELFTIAETIKNKFSTIAGIKNVTDSWGMRSKKLVVNVNKTRARLAGITNSDIAISLSTLLTGAQTGEFREEDKVIPIIMKNGESGPKDIARLESLNIYAQQSGKTVPLKQVADIEIVWQYPKIVRRDQVRTLTVLADLHADVNAAGIMKTVTPWLTAEQEKWPSGYSYVLGGEAEESEEGMQSVARNLPLSFFIILLLLIGQFNSLRKTVIVLSTIPLGLIGVAMGLIITRSYFGFMGFLGIISLSGIVINNAIVLLDRIKIEQDELGKAPLEAIVAAAQQRFRPILLTTATTSLGLIPLWLSGGVMWEPMAIAILFGLLFATVITLLFVPVLYKLFYRIRYAG